MSKHGLRLVLALVCMIPPAMAADPARYDLAFASHLGSTNFDSIRDVCVDSQGSIVAVGGTSSPDFPTTPGVYCRTYNGGSTQGTPGSIGNGGGSPTRARSRPSQRA